MSLHRSSDFLNLLPLKVGDGHFLRDDKHRHDTGLEISISRSGLIAIQFNYCIVLPIFDKNHVYLPSNLKKIDGKIIEYENIFYQIRR